MSYGLRYAVEQRKKQLIEKLIDVGVYKVLNKQLYELSLDELEKEYNDLLKYEDVRAQSIILKFRGIKGDRYG